MMSFPVYLQFYSSGNSIYVLGGQGENLAAMTQADRETFIYNHEHGIQSNIDRDIALYNQKVSEGYTDIYCFDCSGLIMNYMLNIAHCWTYDMSAQGIYDHCNYHPTASNIQPYDFCFFSEDRDGDVTNIVHVGVYIGNGLVTEAQGRDVGVVVSNFNQRPWEFFGHFTPLEPFIPSPSPVHRNRMPVWMMLDYKRKGRLYSLWQRNQAKKF